MKVTLNLFDVGELEFHVERALDGTLVLTKGFYAFLDRPGRPHVSLFMATKPGRSYLEPHFTAFRKAPKEFRVPLEQVQPEALHRGLEACASLGAAQYFRELQPADLDALEAEGWTVHFLNAHAVRRWLRGGPPWRLDARTSMSLAKHLVRHIARPSELKALDPSFREAAFPALRFDEAGRLRTRILMRFPDEVPVSRLVRGEGVPETLPAGWYMMEVGRSEPACAWDFSTVVPAKRIEAIGDKLRELLVRYPQRGTAPDLDAAFEAVPCELSAVFGMYAGDILNCIVAIKAEREAANAGQSAAE